MEQATYKVLSGDAAEIERSLNRLADSYIPVFWGTGAGNDGVEIVCVLISVQAVRKAQLGAIAQMPIPFSRPS